MERVKLPKEVAEAIEQVREKGVYDNRNYEIMEFIVGTPDESDALYGAAIILNQFATNENFDRLLSALVNGYEVEQTPEGHIKNYFNHYCKQEPYHRGYQQAVLDCLDILKMKIEGVNA